MSAEFHSLGIQQSSCQRK